MSMSDTTRPGDAPAGGMPEGPDAEPLGGGSPEGGTIADRVGRDPSNLGDEVQTGGDVQHPTPDPGGSNI